MGKTFDTRLIDDFIREVSKRFGKKFKFKNGTSLKIRPYGFCAIVSFS